MLPREHGSWALLAVPVFAGLAAAPASPAGPALLIAVAALGAFLARVPLLSLAAPKPAPSAGLWLASDGALALLGLAPLLWRYERWSLLWFGLPAAAALAVNVVCVREKNPFSWFNELTGISAMSIGAPAAYYAVSGALEPRAWWLWAAVTLFFAGPVFHVKAAALRHRAANDASLAMAAGEAGRMSTAFHLGTTILAAAAASAGAIPLPLVAAFALAFGKAARAAGLPPGRADFRRLGWIEVGCASAFLLAAAAGYR
ncbi:MAG: YwiC-like family protein [Elusimicrobia bacterium]|nr:YwiC-like family protein [Elusimicrobiota bacterium]